MENRYEIFPPLSDEQLLMLKTIARIVDDVVAPRAAEIDVQGEFPWDLQGVFSEQGLFGLSVGKEYGGLGESLLMMVLVMEELARACSASAMMVGTTAISVYPMDLLATQEQKSRYFPGLATGDLVPCIAYSEPEAGSDLASLKTKAIREDDHWIINGQKRWITQAPVADLIILLARTDPHSKDHKGISFFVIEKKQEGIMVGRHEDKIGARGSPTSDLIFEDAKVPLDALMGEEGKGFIAVMNSLEKERVVAGALALGCSRGAVDYAARYAMERKQFGREIGRFQGLQFLLADMRIKYEASRALLIQAAQKTDAGAKDRSVISSMAKAFASEVAMEVTTHAVQVLGGYGVTKEYPVERMMRDAKITQIFAGTTQIQQSIIAQRMLDL
jgi:alkylation response protein AidB-like acyl-CoA dehydrogenase